MAATAEAAGGGGAPAPRPTATAQATERRLVSVLFADLVGSTPLAEGRDPEDVRALLSAYFDSASEAVERHGGVVEKFIGDAVMAVWGTPVAHEDDAERAVRCGLDIVDRVAALGRRLTLPLEARVGILTGEAVATVGAVGQAMVAGDLVNTASRLQAVAEPGAVVVGEATYHAAVDAIAFLPLGPLTLKGKQEPVQGWQALRVVSQVGGSGRGSVPEPPFVGRDEELRLAKELLHATGREHRPRLLSVTGVAGIGKSRLLWELRKYVDGLAESVFWHEGRCPAYGEGVTFWAFAEMVRGRAGIAETDDEATARDRLRACLDEVIPDDEERRWLAPRLGHLLGLDPEPPGGREELFGAWRRFVERIADRGATVLAFEDLHWADPGMLDFIESLLAWSRTSPIFVIGLARPELSEHRPTWGAGARALSAVHLEPLTGTEIAALLTGYVEGLPAADVQRLVDRAEGIPLYAVETVRMLADRGVLEQVGSVFRVVSELGLRLDVPETLHALVAARLDGLPDAERSLLLDAAVAGHSFTLQTLCAVSGRPADEVELRLRGLMAKDVLELEADPRSAERGQYRFVQSVIREVAYATLSKGARRAKHLACADWLVTLGEDDLAGVIASHLLDAYQAEPSAADAEHVAAEARTWLRRAADRAFSLGSPESAQAYAVKALALATSPAERAALQATAATGAALAGDWDTAWATYVAASDAYRVVGDAEAEGRLLAQASQYPFERAAEAELRGRLEDVEKRLLHAGPARAAVQAALARLAASEGRSSDALRWSEEAIVLAQTLHDDDVLFDAAAARTFALANADRQFEAVLLAEGLVALAERSGSVLLRVLAAMHFGVTLGTEDHRRSMTVFLDGAATAARAGIRPAQAMALANAAEAALDAGELDVAADALADAHEIGGAERLDQDGVALSQAMLAAYRGDPAAAWDILGRLEEQRRPSWSALAMTTWFLRTRGAVRLLDGDPAGALADARESLALEASGGNAATALWQGVRAAARLRDADAIDDLLATTVGLRGAWVDDVRVTAQAIAAGLRGDLESASTGLARALRAWRQRVPLDHAFAVAGARHAVPEGLAPQEDVDLARDYLRALGAPGLLRLL